MGSGQWAVGSGQWAVESGQWAVGRGVVGVGDVPIDQEPFTTFWWTPELQNVNWTLQKLQKHCVIECK